ncbi:hypothetical protein V6N13_094994 [Hibiscus sabdariffa]|uniref:Peptidase metallopeptidase domain-containing protein n=1 Tax=Hibiscus sabdariffa TaxID=183260 RepID=A0ABR2PSZ5_9ROSI
MTTWFSYQLFGAILVLFLSHPFVAESGLIKPESLQDLKQAKKGDVVNGINQVKQFLGAFGYYPRGTDVLDDEFDDALEDGLGAFQQVYSLKVTGKIDPDTIKAMSAPRCGVPDVSGVNRASNRHGHGHGHGHGMFYFVAKYSFFPENPRWSRYQLTYNFLPDSVQVVNFQDLRGLIARAFRKWANVSPFRFTEVAQGTRADIRIGFYRRDHGDGSPFDGPGRVLAHAFSPEDGRFHYDAEENWSTNPTRSQVDLESVAVHEMGHNLGLGHSKDRNAIMFPTFQVGTTKRNLGQDDINGLRALYRY